MAIYPAAGDRLNAMTKPGGLTERHARWHGRTMDLQENVKAYGAVGDGVADDTAAIQAAIDAASAAGGLGNVYLPRGDYNITSALNLNGADNSGIRLSGAYSKNPEQVTTRGTRIIGSVASSLVSRTTTVESSVIIEDIAFYNTHATGTCLSLAGMSGANGVNRCWLLGYKGLTLGNNTFTHVVSDCFFRRRGASAVAGSYGISSAAGHKTIINCDFSGFDQGISGQNAGWFISGCRIEVCVQGILGTGSFQGAITGCRLEANDYGIYLAGAGAMSINGIGILGSAGSPAGGSLVGLYLQDVQSGLVCGVAESGSHATAFVQTAGSSIFTLSFMSVQGTTAWTIPNLNGISIINCYPVTNIVRSPVIATASLPAAGATQDGRTVIEDNGAGDRNLIIYAGGQRFRIDGGAAI